MQDYPFKIERKWQEAWTSGKLFSPDLVKARTPFYNLMMFPYPSAEGLHVGNMYAFTGSDIYGRFKRMQGFDVFEPIGLDGFGIHSENYAIKVGRHPRQQARISQKNFYRQLYATGNAYDWTRTLATYDPAYYKWTQWIFIQLFKKGLAYRARAPVNSCPFDKTVLADEQVVDGRCESCGSQVEKRDLEQWFFRITDYAERLLKNLEKLDWSKRVKIAQRQWIGKKEGITIGYQVAGSRLQVGCWTSRPDTNFGATFVVLAPEHELVSEILNIKYQISNIKLKEVKSYVKRAKKKTEQERIAEGRDKTGVFTGLYAVNNLNGEKLPIWVSDFVLMEFGTGAVVAVPGHDRRDFEFAQKFGLPIKRVVVGKDGDDSPITKIDQVQEEEGTMVNSDFLNGLDTHKATVKIMDYLEEKGWGKRKTTYHLRDWLISRQRYWGPPIPVIYCVNCWKVKSEKLKVKSEEGRDFAMIDGKEHAIIPVPEKDLPVILPDVKDWKPRSGARGPLAQVESFVKTLCPECGTAARRETDVSDTFLDSAWYYLGYLILGNQKSKINPSTTLRIDGEQSRTIKNQKFRNWELEFRNSLARRGQWLPVDMYIGGAEHSVLHLLYSRFLTMAFYDLGLVSFEEPFRKFRAHGLLIAQGAKMSKSKGNIVSPDDYIAKYGADALRCYLMFCGRFQQGGDFSDAGIAGMHRFLKRVWNLVIGQLGYWAVRSAPKNLLTQEPISLHMMHKTIRRVTEDIESLDYNTAIAALMEWLNFLEQKVNIKYQISNIKYDQKRPSDISLEPLGREETETYLKLLAPFAPHITEELWSRLSGNWACRPSALRLRLEEQSGKTRPKNLRAQRPNDRIDFQSIHTQPWPKYDPKLVESKKITLVVQVDGKLRDRLEAKKGLGEKDACKLALSSQKIKKYLAGANYKVVYIKDRLINFVLKF